MKKLVLALILVIAVLAGGYFYLAYKPIHKAAREGSLFSIKQYLNRGENIDQFSPRAFISGFTMEETPLHHAVIGNQPEAVTLLLERGANPDAPNIFKMTPLHYAVAYHHLEIIKILLDKGANPNSVGGYGRSPLQLILLENYPNYLRQPLLTRTVTQQLQIMDLLLSYGADLEFKDKYGQTAFHLAAKTQSIEIMQFLIDKGANHLALDNAGNNALIHLLVSDGISRNKREFQYESFQFLIDQGLDFRHKNDNQQSLLHYSCNEQITEFLLNQGLEVNAVDVQSTTPLSKLLVSLHCLNPEKVVVRLLKAGANPNLVDAKNVAPLHRVMVGNLGLKLVPVLLDFGADVRLKSSKYGDTPLHLAARNKRAENAMELLLNHGAPINEQNDKGCTPLHKALLGNSDGDNALFLIEKGADLNIAELNGVTPLHLMAIFKNTFDKWKDVFLSSSADLTKTDATGRTPLDWAIDAKNQPAVDVLNQQNAPKGVVIQSEKIRLEDLACRYF